MNKKGYVFTCTIIIICIIFLSLTAVRLRPVFKEYQKVSDAVSKTSASISKMEADINADAKPDVVQTKLGLAKLVCGQKDLKMKSITAISKNSTESFDIVTVNEVKDVAAFTSVVNRMLFQLEFRDLRKAIKQLSTLELAIDSFNVDRKQGIINLQIIVPLEKEAEPVA